MLFHLPRRMFAWSPRSVSITLVVCGLVAAVTVSGPSSPSGSASIPGSAAFATDDTPLSEFMRKKLGAADMVLEGLVLEDDTLVKQGATALNEMSKAERWRVLNDPLYRQFSADYQRLTQQLIDAAEKKNFDQAALRWIDVTLSCMECHRFVRGVRVSSIDR